MKYIRVHLYLNMISRGQITYGSGGVQLGGGVGDTREHRSQIGEQVSRENRGFVGAMYGEVAERGDGCGESLAATRRQHPL